MIARSVPCLRISVSGRMVLELMDLVKRFITQGESRVQTVAMEIVVNLDHQLVAATRSVCIMPLSLEPFEFPLQRQQMRLQLEQTAQIQGVKAAKDKVGRVVVHERR